MSNVRPWSVLVVALVAPLLPAPTLVAQEPDAPTVAAPGIEFSTPPFDVPPEMRDGIRFGYLVVPQDHLASDGHTLRIAVAILPALGAPAAEDPILYLPGGPGLATVERAVWFAGSSRYAILRQRRDLILIDPRGHGLSEPRSCPDLEGARPLSDGLGEAAANWKRKLAACREEMVGSGVRLETINSEQVAHDIELLRRAMGVSQLNLLGSSYGTRLAAEAMRQIPGSIRAVHLDAPLPPGLQWSRDHGRTASEVLAALLRRCSERPECEAAFGNLSSDLDTLLLRARRTPYVLRLPASDRAPGSDLILDEQELRVNVAQLLSNRELAAGVPLLIHTVAERGFDMLDDLLPPLLRALTPGHGFDAGTNLAYRCNDMPFGPESARMLRRLCPVWVGAATGGSRGERLHSDIPTLVMTGEFDPRTPPSFAKFVMEGLTRGQYVELPWMGHDVPPECGFRIARDFFDSPGQTLDVACVDSIPPITFLTRVAVSRWTSRAVMRAADHPAWAGVSVGSALLLLLIPAVGLPAGAMRPRLHSDGVARRGFHPATGTLWIATLTALALLLGTAVGVWMGGRKNVVIPALGLPSEWGWVLVLPWLLLALGMAAVVLILRAPAVERAPGFARWSACLGIALVLVIWAVNSVV
jgi:pimeloyl-ACP methyl ester carboxylesterase